jgi:hypothetical protein
VPTRDDDSNKPISIPSSPSPGPEQSKVPEIIDLTGLFSPSPPPAYIQSPPVGAAHVWGPGTAAEPIELDDEEYDKRWPADYYTCDVAEFLKEVQSLTTKRGAHPAVFTKYFPFAVYKRSTISDQRKKLRRAPNHLKVQAIAAGRTYQGLWSTFMQNIKYYEQDRREGMAASTQPEENLIDLS